MAKDKREYKDENSIKSSHLDGDTSENTIKAELDAEDIRDYLARNLQSGIGVIDLSSNVSSPYNDRDHRQGSEK